MKSMVFESRCDSTFDESLTATPMTPLPGGESGGFRIGKEGIPMSFLEMRVPTAICVVLVILGLPASVSALLIGVPYLIRGSWADFVPALVLCGLGVFLMIMAIAALRGTLRGNKRPNRDASDNSTS
jgi:hypothetical protein